MENTPEGEERQCASQVVLTALDGPRSRVFPAATRPLATWPVALHNSGRLRPQVTHAQFADHAEVIESVLGRTARQHRLAPDQADEFSSWVRLRLLEDDGAILRKFGGRSSLSTYLTVVVQRLFLDWRTHEWGKWRPTAEARRVGPIAIELERLVRRDQLEWEQAKSLVVSRGIAGSEQECEAAWARLPHHPVRRHTGDAALRTVAAPEQDPLQADRRERAARASTALARAIGTLSAQDQILVKLHFQDNVPLSRLAPMVAAEPRLIYRRMQQLFGQLRASLEANGVTVDEVRDLVGEGPVEIARVLDTVEAKDADRGPSNRQMPGARHE